MHEAAKKFLNDPTSRFTSLELPLTHSHLQSAFLSVQKLASKFYKHKEKPVAKDNNKLCVELQEALENYLKGHKNHRFHIGMFHTTKIETNDPYLQEGIHDCLKHIFVEMIKHSSKDTLALPIGFVADFSLPICEIYLEAHAEANHAHFLVFDISLQGHTHITDLKSLGTVLPKCQSFKHIKFENTCAKSLCCTDDKGIDYLKDILIKMPNLELIDFKHLAVVINERNAEILAQVIIERAKDKKCTSIKDIRFLDSSITKEGALAFLKALKDYKSDIGIMFGPNNNMLITNPFGIETFQKILENQHLHVRFTSYLEFSESSIVYVYDRHHKTVIAVRGMDYRKY